MECYNLNCQEECNDLKKQYCIFRINEQQKELAIKINKNNCEECGMKTVRVKFWDREARLCTSCGRISQANKIVEICWVNSRRAI